MVIARIINHPLHQLINWKRIKDPQGRKKGESGFGRHSPLGIQTPSSPGILQKKKEEKKITPPYATRLPAQCGLRAVIFILLEVGLVNNHSKRLFANENDVRNCAFTEHKATSGRSFTEPEKRSTWVGRIPGLFFAWVSLQKVQSKQVPGLFSTLLYMYLLGHLTLPYYIPEMYA